jgi:uncharacterized protein
MSDIAQPSSVTETSPPAQQQMAPLWHTLLLILILAGVSAGSYFSSRHFVTENSEASPSTLGMLVTYGATIVQEWVLFFLVLWGERMRSRMTVRERIGIRAEKDALIRDIGIAVLAVGAAYVVNGAVGFLLHPAGREVVLKLLPHNLAELALWIPLSVSAGFCEEYMFRGYFQRQFGLLTGSMWAGVIIQAALFAFGHGYQGPALMVGIFGLGLIFGITAKLRKSVRPAMFAHAWIDFFTGLAGYIAFAMHLKIPLK